MLFPSRVSLQALLFLEEVDRNSLRADVVTHNAAMSTSDLDRWQRSDDVCASKNIKKLGAGSLKTTRHVDKLPDGIQALAKDLVAKKNWSVSVVAQQMMSSKSGWN